MLQALHQRHLKSRPWELKSDLMDFNDIWRQQYSFVGVDYALYLFSK